MGTLNNTISVLTITLNTSGQVQPFKGTTSNALLFLIYKVNASFKYADYSGVNANHLHQITSIVLIVLIAIQNKNRLIRDRGNYPKSVLKSY